MTGKDLFIALGNISPKYYDEAENDTIASSQGHKSLRRPLLIAAVIALTLLLVGCAVAYANGWFQQIFSARSDTPLSSEQIQYIQDNEQLVGQSRTKNDWTIDLKSTICDGSTGYLVFQIIAPDDVDLEQYLNPPTVDDKRLSMGNYSASRKAAYSMAVASIGTVDTERNYWYLDSGDWISDGDGQPNTVLFCMTIRCERMDPNKPMLLEDPFSKDVSFRIRLMGITLEYTNLELRKEIEEKYAGQDYLVDGEEAAGLFCSDILTDEQWDFDISFDPDNQFVELITQPVSAQGKVWRYGDEKQWEVRESLEEVQIASLRVTPFGANITYVPKPDAVGISPRLGKTMEDAIYAVMKDGSRIKLDLSGNNDTVLQAESPIVLSQLDSILLEDGTAIPLLYPPKEARQTGPSGIE